MCEAAYSRGRVNPRTNSGVTHHVASAVIGPGINGEASLSKAEETLVGWSLFAFMQRSMFECFAEQALANFRRKRELFSVDSH